MSRVLGVLLMAAVGSFGVSSAAGDARTQTRVQPDRVPLLFGEEYHCSRVLGGEMFSRTELVFGMSRSFGPDITETEFQSFVDDQVTTRFPDGLTLLSGNGQFKDSSGTIVQEKSKLLVLLYPFSKSNNKLVEAIRAEYKAMFQQESVLRIDEESCVSF